ncbi:MAG: SH3 domain-containing protein [Anaerolineales bacterium]|nr:SH3 domain-containing protein [Anaerolineales bacterium]
MFSITILRVSIQRSTIAFILLAVLSMGCDIQVREAAPTAIPVLITATLPATPTQISSETLPPPPPPPTTAPVKGVTSTQINVRAEPSTAANVLGMIPANTEVEITGKDPGENWWQISYPQGPDGKGWVTAQYVTTAASPQVPTIGGGQAGSPGGNVAVVQQQLNVRSGPGTGFNSLGTLNPQDVVRLTGKDSNGAWLQIDFPAGPEGKGWVNAAFVQAQGVENLPIITEAGLVVGTGTPTVIPATPTATFQPAWEDDDSAQSPSINIIFSALGTHDLQYSSDVSSPTGDREDWLQFTPYTGSVLLEVSCKGSNVQVEVSQAAQRLEQTACPDQKRIPVKPGNPVHVHVSVLQDGSQKYSAYTLRVRSIP